MVRDVLIEMYSFGLSQWDNGRLFSCREDYGGSGANSRYGPERLHQQAVQIARTAAADFEEIVVVPGYMMAFGDFRKSGDPFEKCRAAVRTVESDGDECGERIAGGFGVHQRGIAADYAAFFEAMHAVRSRGCGKTQVLR
jgi:hypothetical protein